MAEARQSMEDPDKMRSELVSARAQIDALWRTLRTVAPEYVVTEDEMEAIVQEAVPIDEALEHLDRVEGRSHG